MDRFIESFDYKIFTTIEGTGHPVVLLHSLWGNHMLFDNLANLLSGTYRVIRIDFPGHGNSLPPQKIFTFDEFALILNDILHQLKVEEEIHFIGHSMGGFAALAFSRNYRQKVASLILVHSLSEGPDHKSIRHRLRQAELIRNHKKKLLLQFANESNFAPGNATKYTDFYSSINQASAMVSDESALAAIHAINTRQNNLPFLMNAKIPTFFIIGKYDRIYDPQDQLWEQKNIPGSDLLFLNNSGHLGFFEEEILFNEKCDAFLSSVSHSGKIIQPAQSISFLA